MDVVAGEHVQMGTGRTLRYRFTFTEVGETVIACFGIVREGPALLSSIDLDFSFDPAGVPAASLVRLHVVAYLDRAEFGEGVLPDPRHTRVDRRMM